jgi:LysM repeat protein
MGLSGDYIPIRQINEYRVKSQKFYLSCRRGLKGKIMSDKETAQDVIESYRKRQQQARKAPLLIIVAAVLLVVGAAVLIFWLLGPNKSAISLFATETPTSTVTSTSTKTSTVTPTQTNTSTASLTPTETLTPTPEGPFTYVVVQGDTLFTIAEKFQVNLDTLIAINNLDPASPIDIGDQITIPGPDTELPTETPIPLSMRSGTIIEYVVKSGETLAMIADKFNSVVDEIVKENEIDNPNTIQAGTKLKVPVNLVTPVPTNTPGPSPTPPPSATLSPSPTPTATSAS